MAKKTVNILFVCMARFKYATQECLEMIRAISHDVKVTDITDLLTAEQNGDAQAKKQMDALLLDADIFYGNTPPENIIARAPKLKWMQTPLAGVDRFLVPDIIASPVVLTSGRGMHSQVAELVMEMILMFAKREPDIFRAQQQKQWLKVTPEILESKTVGILGLGNIGREVARFSKAFRMNVIGTRSKRVRTRYVDETLTPEQTPELLAKSDYVVVALPFTPDTDKLIGEKQLRMMKPTAILINIARGKIVDEEALVRALEAGWIGGAGLDVAVTEPMSPESPLWDFPNVIITPHIGGPIVTYMQVATKMFNVNLKRFMEGKKLRSIVNKKKGY